MLFVYLQTLYKQVYGDISLAWWRGGSFRANKYPYICRVDERKRELHFLELPSGIGKRSRKKLGSVVDGLRFHINNMYYVFFWGVWWNKLHACRAFMRLSSIERVLERRTGLRNIISLILLQYGWRRFPNSEKNSCRSSLPLASLGIFPLLLVNSLLRCHFLFPFRKISIVSSLIVLVSFKASPQFVAVRTADVATCVVVPPSHFPVAFTTYILPETPVFVVAVAPLNSMHACIWNCFLQIHASTDQIAAVSLTCVRLIKCFPSGTTCRTTARTRNTYTAVAVQIPHFYRSLKCDV